MKNFLLFTAFWCFSYSLFAQQMNFRQVSLGENIRISDLNQIYTDKQGFIWFLGNQSVYRYDGLNYKEIKADSSDDQISSIYQDHTGEVWVGWKSGHISTILNDHFKTYDPEEGTPSAKIVSWTEDSQGQLWLATYGEGLYVKSKSGRWYNISDDDGLPSPEAYDITGFEKGIVVATDQGLVKCSFSPKNKKEIAVIGTEDGLSDQIVKSIFSDTSGLWLAFYDPFVNHLNKKGEIISQKGPPRTDARQILKSGKNIWWLSESGHLYLKSPAGNWNAIEVSPATGLRIKQITTDFEGHLWVLSNRGVFRLDQWIERFPTNKAVTAVAKKGDNLWFSQDKKLFKVNFKTGQTSLVWSGANMILSIFVDDYNRVWAGTFDGGVIVWDDKQQVLKRFTEANGLANNNVLAIDGNSKELWLGTLGGASRFRFLGTKIIGPESFNKQEGLDIQYIYTVHLAKNGEVLLGTDGQGIMRWSKDHFEPLIKRMPQEVVLDLCSDTQGRIWWITQQGKLHVTQSDTVREIPPFEKEMGKAVGLVSDPNSILVFYEYGIGRWDIEQQRWSIYDEAFGLKDFEPQLHAQFLASDNYLYSGTANGITVLQLQFLQQQSLPETFLEGVELYFNPTSQSEFAADENHITFRYIGRWYNDPSTVRYKIKLEGYDLGWSITKDDEITYPRLSPGRYTFKVVAGINRQFPDDQLKTFSFVINPPWYAHWYIWLMAVVVLIVFVYSIFKLREQQIKHKQDQEKEHVRAQYEALRSQVNPHFLFNSFNTLMALIEDRPDEAQVYLSDLSDFFRNILKFRDVDLISLREELQVTKTYLQLQARRYDPNLLVEIDVADKVLNTQIPPLTLQLLVENALKHNVISRLKPLELKIYTDDNYLIVWNTLQEKVTREISMGYGLESIQKKYVFYTEKEVVIISGEYYFEVRLPLLNLK